MQKTPMIIIDFIINLVVAKNEENNLSFCQVMQIKSVIVVHICHGMVASLM